MDDCHARTQHYADCPGHGKNYLVREREAYGGSISPVRKPSSERKSREICRILSEAGRHLLRDAIQEGLFKLWAGRADSEGHRREFTQYYDRLLENFQREKQRLIWDNQMIEGRLAVAQQLAEISRLMEMVARDLYDISQPDPDFLESLTRSLKKRHIVLKTAWVMDKAEGRRQIFLTMRARYGTPMTAAGDGRRVLNGEFHTVRFTEDVSYQMLYGVARLTKEQEKVSGDNYACRQEEEGRFVMCLSDGMGSGAEACRESEIVVELLEQFLESGFSQEPAARMV